MHSLPERQMEVSGNLLFLTALPTQEESTVSAEQDGWFSELVSALWRKERLLLLPEINPRYAYY
jgi:hypothetical protein